MTLPQFSDRPAPSFSFLNKRDLTVLFNMLLPVLFLAALAFTFQNFIWKAVEANYTINLGIILTACFGVYLIINRLLAAQRDFRILERFGFEANQGIPMETLLSEPWLRNRYVRHYLNHIARTGGTVTSQLEHSAIESELQALLKDYESRIELPQFLVGFMIAMGLLGTFIGLLETLTGISGMLNSFNGENANIQHQFMELIAELRKPLAGMGIAFSASMFGLITSLMLAIMMTNLRRYISRVISLARNIMHDLLKIAQQQGDGSTNLIEKLEQQGFLSELSPRSGPSVNDTFLAGRFEVLAKKLELLVDSITDNTENTKKLNDLIGFGPRMKEINEKTLDEMRLFSAKQIEVLKSLENLEKELAEDRGITINNGRHLNEIKENLIKIGRGSNFVELMASSLGTQNALLEQLLEETKRSQQGLAIINKSISDLKN